MGEGVCVRALGNSGAILSVGGAVVLKEDMCVELQARYLVELQQYFGALVPKVLGAGVNWYTMERLCGVPILDEPEKFIQEAVGLLMPLWSTRLMSHRSWVPDFSDWLTTCVDKPTARRLRSRLTKYSRRRNLQYYIHGDATLANLMRRGSGGKLVFIDPLRPQGKIPGYPEVDRGKLLQSAIGWEHELAGRKMPGMQKRACVNAALSGLTKEVVERSWFWCAVHLIRLLPYAEKNNPHVLPWAHDSLKGALDAAGI